MKFFISHPTGSMGTVRHAKMTDFHGFWSWFLHSFVIFNEIIFDFDNSELWRWLGWFLGSLWCIVHGSRSKIGFAMVILRDLGGEISPRNPPFEAILGLPEPIWHWIWLVKGGYDRDMGVEAIWGHIMTIYGLYGGRNGLFWVIFDWFRPSFGPFRPYIRPGGRTRGP